jgi:hypothetical protein
MVLIAADLRIVKGTVIIRAIDIEGANEPTRHLLDGYRQVRVRDFRV